MISFSVYGVVFCPLTFLYIFFYYCITLDRYLLFLLYLPAYIMITMLLIIFFILVHFSWLLLLPATHILWISYMVVCFVWFVIWDG